MCVDKYVVWDWRSNRGATRQTGLDFEVKWQIISSSGNLDLHEGYTLWYMTMYIHMCVKVGECIEATKVTGETETVPSQRRISVCGFVSVMDCHGNIHHLYPHKKIRQHTNSIYTCFTSCTDHRNSNFNAWLSKRLC